MAIVPLPQFEADAHLKEQADRELYEKLQPPKTVVVRYGVMKMIGEFPYDGQAKPGCGSKLVVRTFRGTEVGEMLTSTCPNSGCSKSVSRKDMLEYISNSGGKQYPFSTGGRVLRVATADDVLTQQKIEQSRHELKMRARRACEELRIPTKIVDAEPILGGEVVTFYYAGEQRMDVRYHEQLAAALQRDLGQRIDLRVVGARDEARITADYERCGQYCCCKNFLKVLKPVQMRSAKVQKATLDPLKISGRCGRLMCCLRYEDSTYEELRKKLPRRKSRVGTPHGDGLVIDGQILTQLVLVELESSGERVAVPIEELEEPKGPPPPPLDQSLPPLDRDRSRPMRPAGPSQQRPRQEHAEPRSDATSDEFSEHANISEADEGSPDALPEGVADGRDAGPSATVGGGRPPTQGPARDPAREQARDHSRDQARDRGRPPGEQANAPGVSDRSGEQRPPRRRRSRAADELRKNAPPTPPQQDPGLERTEPGQGTHPHDHPGGPHASDQRQGRGRRRRRRGRGGGGGPSNPGPSSDPPAP